MTISNRIGRFAKPVLKPKHKNGHKASVGSVEYNGNSSGKFTVALGVCSIPKVLASVGAVSYDSPWYLMGMAIIRRILKKHYGVNVLSPDQYFDMLVPPVYQTQGTNPIETIPRLAEIQFYYKDVSDLGNPVGLSFNITMPKTTDALNTRTVGYVAALIGENIRGNFGVTWSQTAAGGTNFQSVNNQRELYGYSLQEYISMASGTITGPSNRVYTSIYRLDNMIVDMLFITKIRIQNVSPGSYNDNGTVKYIDSDVVEHNPLVGKMYHFSDPFPILSPKVTSVVHNNNATTSSGATPTVPADFVVFSKDSNNDGIVKPNGNDLFGLRHIPTPDMFTNVSGFSLIKLMPGEMKTRVQKFKFNGFLNKLIAGLSFTSNYTGVSGFAASYKSAKKNAVGTFDLFCLEDYNGGHVSDGSVVDLKISYEVNRFGKMKFVKQVHEGMELMRNYTTPVTDVTADT